ncbi:hypothetical protein MRX96_033588 [Rhipicephalus microplus]
MGGGVLVLSFPAEEEWRKTAVGNSFICGPISEGMKTNEPQVLPEGRLIAGRSKPRRRRRVLVFVGQVFPADRSANREAVLLARTVQGLRGLH